MKRLLIALGIATVLFAGVYGLAASLNVTSSTLGAGSATVAACQSTAINVTYATTYSSTVPGYTATTVTLNGVDESAGKCVTKPFKVTLTGAANASLGEQTGTTGSAGASATESVTFSGVSAASVTGVHVTITG